MPNQAKNATSVTGDYNNIRTAATVTGTNNVAQNVPSERNYWTVVVD